jgi:hypothetical protein
MNGVQSTRGLLVSIGRRAAGAGERFGSGRAARSCCSSLPAPTGTNCFLAARPTVTVPLRLYVPDKNNKFSLPFGDKVL